ncbi:MAG: response regulator [Oscillospiraceae bacterium]|jgi:two-component system response regulator YesN|nr:response regulator [Oscillospiraceae bacterium]
MWKIILVDDEKVIRETIGQVLRWEDMGIELAGICKNGLEAFDMIVDESPDIVLTDICMPGFSGLDLIEKVCSSQIDIEFVILSGYGEFDYAQKAMEYGVKHYILKPCDERQIREVIEKAAAACEKKRLTRERESNVVRREQILRTMREIGTTLAEGGERKAQALEDFRRQLEASEDLSFAKATAVQFLLSFWQAVDGVSQLMWLNLLFDVNAALDMQQIWELSIQGIQQAHIAHKPQGTYKDYIKKCISYTNEHYGDPSLTLKWISENVLYMNVDYVSKQFLSQVGEKFSAYLGSLRIKKAQALLANGEKVNAVAQEVGCGNNPQYFSQMFKKYTGMSPKNWQIQNETGQ